jgi:hypothetical protein
MCMPMDWQQIMSWNDRGGLGVCAFAVLVIIFSVCLKPLAGTICVTQLEVLFGIGGGRLMQSHLRPTCL